MKVPKAAEPVISKISSKVEDVKTAGLNAISRPREVQGSGNSDKPKRSDDGQAYPKLPYEVEGSNGPPAAFGEASEPSQITPGEEPKKQLTGEQEENPQLIASKDDKSRKAATKL